MHSEHIMTDLTQAAPVSKTVGGVTFEDRFAHLHEDTAEGLAWQWQRDAQAQKAAESSPNYAPVRDRLLQLGKVEKYTVPRKCGSLWFDYVEEGDDLVLRASETPNGPGRDVVSKKSIAEAIVGGDVMLAWMQPSPKGRYVAFAWGVNGDMIGKWSVYETATGRHIADASGIMYTGGHAGWLPD